jgi:hypothetical protein
LRELRDLEESPEKAINVMKFTEDHTSNNLVAKVNKKFLNEPEPENIKSTKSERHSVGVEEVKHHVLLL